MDTFFQEAVLGDGQLLTTPPRDSAPRRADRIVLMVCDPNSLYAYWDSSIDLSQDGHEQPTDWVMRLHDVTVGGPPDLNLRDFVDYQCGAGATDGVLGDVIPGRTYRVDLGYRPHEQDFVSVAISNEVQTPPDEPSGWVEDHFVTVKWDQDLESFEPPPILSRPPPEPVRDPGDWAAVPQGDATEEEQMAQQATHLPAAADEGSTAAPADAGAGIPPVDGDPVCQPERPATDLAIEPTAWRGNETVRWAAGSIPGTPPLDAAFDATVAGDHGVTTPREDAAPTDWSAMDAETENQSEGPVFGITKHWVSREAARVNDDGTSQIRRQRDNLPLRVTRRLPFRGAFEDGNLPSSITRPREQPGRAEGSETPLSSSITADGAHPTWCSPAVVTTCDESPGDGHSAQ